MRPPSWLFLMNTTSWWRLSVLTGPMLTRDSTKPCMWKTFRRMRWITGRRYSPTVSRILWFADSIRSWKPYMKKRICRWRTIAGKRMKRCLPLCIRIILTERRQFSERRRIWKILPLQISKSISRLGMYLTIWLFACPVIWIRMRRWQLLKSISVHWSRILICRNARNRKSLR